MSETDRIEYKETLTNDLEKEVVAFLNASGGNMYIGVKNNGEVIVREGATTGQWLIIGKE